VTTSETYHWGMANSVGLHNAVRHAEAFPNLPDSYYEELRQLHSEIITWIDPLIDQGGLEAGGILKSLSYSVVWTSDLASASGKICQEAQKHSGKEWHEVEDIIYMVFGRYIRAIRYATKQWDYDRYLYEKERKSTFFSLKSFVRTLGTDRGGYYLPLLAKTQDEGFYWVIDNSRKEILEQLVESYIQGHDWRSSFLEQLLCRAILKCDIYEHIYKIRENPSFTEGLFLEKNIDKLQGSLAELELKAGWVFLKEHRILNARKQLNMLRTYDSFNRMLRISRWLSRPWIQPENILRAIELDFEETGLEYRESLHNLLNHVVNLGHRWYP
jgi:hypothetical protein